MYNSTPLSHLERSLPLELWDSHVLRFLPLRDAVALAELSRYFYAVLHEHARLHAPVSIASSVRGLQRVLQAWSNLTDVSFQPVEGCDSDYDGAETETETKRIVYNVNAAGGLAIAGDQVDGDGQDRALERSAYECSPALQRLICGVGQDDPHAPSATPQAAAGPVRRLNLSGIAHVRLFEGVGALDELGLSGCGRIDGLHLLLGVRAVDLSYCAMLEDVGFLRQSAHVDLSYCHGVTDLRPLRACASVQLNVCRGVRDVRALAGVPRLSLRNCPRLRDVSALRHVRELNLSGCAGVTDVSALGGGRVRTLNLSGCVGVTDVSMLGRVHSLSLRNCHGVVDVSALGGVHALDLTGCHGVADVRALGRVHSLDLSLCRLVSDVSALRVGVVALSLRQCASVADVSMLGREGSPLRSLDLSGCLRVASVAHLSGLDRLVLRRCDQLETLQGVGRVAELDVSFCRNLRALGDSLRGVRSLRAYRCVALRELPREALARVRRVDLSGCARLRDVSAVRSAREADLRFCDALEDVRPLAGARVLQLAGCARLADVSPLRRVETLDLGYCPALADVRALAGVRALSLQHCARLADVSALGRVRALNLSGCHGVTDVRALRHVRELNLSDCAGLARAPDQLRALAGVRVLDLRFNERHAVGDGLREVARELRKHVPVVRL